MIAGCWGALFPNVAQIIEMAPWLRNALWELFTLSHVPALSEVMQENEVNGLTKQRDLSKLCARCRWDYIEAARKHLRLRVVKRKSDIIRAVCSGCVCPSLNHPSLDKTFPGVSVQWHIQGKYVRMSDRILLFPLYLMLFSIFNKWIMRKFMCTSLLSFIAEMPL